MLDLLFPRRSLTGEEGMFVTVEEFRKLQSQPILRDAAYLRAHGIRFLDRVTAAADYRKVPLLHRAVHVLKYKKVKDMGEVLGRMLVGVSEVIEGSPVLCPVPLHWIRKYSRGFNQAEILARFVGEQRGWAVMHLLRRRKWTGSQVGRKRDERLTGVSGAFALCTRQKIPEYVVLIDDLSTTGSTLDACAEPLKKAGVPRVEALLVASRL